MNPRRASSRPSGLSIDRTASVLCCHRTTRSPADWTADAGAIRAPSKAGFVNRPGWREFRGVLVGLRLQCPTAMPVVVRASPLPETILCQCVRRQRRFVVKLNDRMGEAQAIDTLCHEWAHALAWNFSLDRLAKTPGLDPIEFERACRDEAWGCAYSRVWRAYLEVGRMVA